ncbi:MAG: DUF302 domain-containing protein [Sulfurimonas sp.]|nr:DUF302 domain-containing protein [Sulfurimonas sp.]
MSNKIGIFIGIIVGMVLSLFVTGIAFKVAAPSMFFKEVTSTYDFDKTVELISARINKQEGWHVTGIIDQQQEILENGGADVGKLKIIKFCNAKYSAEMLGEDSSKYMSVKMPLSISVYEKEDGRVSIGLANGYLMARMFSGSRESLVMEKVIRDMEDVMSFLHFRFSLF